MKVVIVNMSDKVGGSAIAAYRTATSLKKYFSTKSIFLVRNKSVDSSEILQTTPNSFARSFERYFNIFTNLLGMQYVYLPFSPVFIRKKIKQIKPDIIHLHNIIGGYFQLSDLKKIEKDAPVVWTLHDMWPLTANGAYTFGDLSFLQMKSSANEKNIYPHIGLPTGNWLLKRKKEIYKNCHFTVVTPSHWLYKLAKESPVMKDKTIHYIPHGIDLDKFKPIERTKLREQFKIPIEAKTLIFSAQQTIFKGGNDLIEILKEINRKASSKVHVILLGNNMEELKTLQNVEIHYLGYIKGEEKIIEAYNMADVLLFPTRADNLPLVILEAIACGKPVVTFNIGGCPEMVVDKYNGFIINDFNYSEAADKCLELLSNDSLLKSYSDNSRKHAEENFSEKKMAIAYHQLFENIIQNKNSITHEG